LPESINFVPSGFFVTTSHFFVAASFATQYSVAAKSGHAANGYECSGNGYFAKHLHSSIQPTCPSIPKFMNDFDASVAVSLQNRMELARRACLGGSERPAAIKAEIQRLIALLTSLTPIPIWGRALDLSAGLALLSRDAKAALGTDWQKQLKNPVLTCVG